MEIIIVVIPTVAVGVHGCDIAGGGIGNDGTDTPGVVGVLGDLVGILVGNGNDVALQVLLEVEVFAVEADTADGILIVVQRNQHILAPDFPEDLGAVQNEIVPDTIDGLAGTDAVGVVGIGVAIKGLELAALFPCQGMAKVRNRVALCVIGNGLLAGAITVYSNFALLSN